MSLSPSRIKLLLLASPQFVDLYGDGYSSSPHETFGLLRRPRCLRCFNSKYSPPCNKIATEEKQNIQVAIFYSPRGDETIPPKFYLIPPKFHLTSTWRIVFLHVEIPKYPRGYRFLRQMHRRVSFDDRLKSHHSWPVSSVVCPFFVPLRVKWI